MLYRLDMKTIFTSLVFMSLIICLGILYVALFSFIFMLVLVIILIANTRIFL